MRSVKVFALSFAAMVATASAQAGEDAASRVDQFTRAFRAGFQSSGCQITMVQPVVAEGTVVLNVERAGLRPAAATFALDFNNASSVSDAHYYFQPAVRYDFKKTVQYNGARINETLTVMIARDRDEVLFINWGQTLKSGLRLEHDGITCNLW